MSIERFDELREAIALAVGDVDLGSIGGSGSWEVVFPLGLKNPHAVVLKEFEGFDTPWGRSARFRLCEIYGQRVLRVAFHGLPGYQSGHNVTVANGALQVAFVMNAVMPMRGVIVDASVGGIKPPGVHDGPLPPWSIVVQADYHAPNLLNSFRQELEVITEQLGGGWLRMMEPCHPLLQQAWYDAATLHIDEIRSHPGAGLFRDGRYVHTDLGPFETPSEIESYRRAGFDVVGRTFAYEVLLARVYGYPIAELNIVANHAEGRQRGEWVKGGMREFYSKCSLLVGSITLDAIRLIGERDLMPVVNPDYINRSPMPFPNRDA